LLLITQLNLALVFLFLITPPAENAKIPCVGGHPKNIIMLCCDAFGVLPPVAKLTKEQAMYYFIR